MALAWPTHPIKYYLYLPQQSAIATRHINRKQYELTDHLGNVRVVISDAKHLDIRPTGYIDEPLITSYSNYYSFGMQMPSVNFSGSNYRYAFNGQETQTEITGSSSHMSAEFWMYDSRIGRRWNLDPKPNPSFSSYSCFESNPVLFADPYGDTIGISNAINDPVGMKALELFASSKEGYDELARYATKGQTIGSITFKKDGDLSDQIDLLINFTGDASKAGGQTGKTFDYDKTHVGALITVNVFKGKGWESDNETFNKLNTIAHEVFIHATSKSNDFLDDCIFNSSNIQKEVVRIMGLTSVHYDHESVRRAAIKAQTDKGSFLLSEYPWPSKGYSVLKTINQKQGWGFTNNEIMSKMWDYSGGLNIDPEDGTYKGGR
jgi:hypothetical protein